MPEYTFWRSPIIIRHGSKEDLIPIADFDEFEGDRKIQKAYSY
ncbi:hypothetical protein [Pleurocapsa sp. PCC 7319]|nr:hypothetical protein [Pleurocapsa sp. PCC 7319]